MFNLLNDLQLSKNFKLSEFLCHDGSKELMLDMRLVERLQQLRDSIGKPITVASGYRNPEYNAKIGGAPGSFHMRGMAADIKVPDMTPLEVGHAAEKVGFLGIGVYTHDGSSFTHVDTRDYKSYWVDDTGHKLIKVDMLQQEQAKYFSISVTEVAEIPPLDVKAALVYTAGKKIKHDSFVNGTYYWYKAQDRKYYPIGWIVSEGKILNGYDGDEILPGGQIRKKGTFLIFKSGKVEVRNMSNLEIKAICGDLWFCIQGFNLFPLDLEGEGYNPDEVGRTTWRPAIGYKAEKNRVVIAVRPETDAARIEQTMKSLGCSGAIGLDAGGTCSARFGGRDIRLSDLLLTNIIYW